MRIMSLGCRNRGDAAVWSFEVVVWSFFTPNNILKQYQIAGRITEEEYNRAARSQLASSIADGSTQQM